MIRFLRVVFHELVLKTAFPAVVSTLLMLVALSLVSYERGLVVRTRTLEERSEQDETVEIEAWHAYIDWLERLGEGDYGRDRYGRRIADYLGYAFRQSGFLLVGSVAAALLVGLLFASYMPRRRRFRLAMLPALVATALPSFFAGMTVLGALGYRPYDQWNLVYAFVTLSLVNGVALEAATLGMAASDSERDRNYVLAGLLRGLRFRRLPLPGSVERHVYRTAIPQVLSAAKRAVAPAVGAQLIIEQLFGLRGLSSLLLNGFLNQDVSLVLTVFLYTVVLCRLVTLGLAFLAWGLSRGSYGA